MICGCRWYRMCRGRAVKLRYKLTDLSKRERHLPAGSRSCELRLSHKGLPTANCGAHCLRFSLLCVQRRITFKVQHLGDGALLLYCVLRWLPGMCARVCQGLRILWLKEQESHSTKHLMRHARRRRRVIDRIRMQEVRPEFKNGRRSFGNCETAHRLRSDCSPCRKLLQIMNKRRAVVDSFRELIARKEGGCGVTSATSATYVMCPAAMHCMSRSVREGVEQVAPLIHTVMRAQIPGNECIAEWAMELLAARAPDDESGVHIKAAESQCHEAISSTKEAISLFKLWIDGSKHGNTKHLESATRHLGKVQSLF